MIAEVTEHLQRPAESLTVCEMPTHTLQLAHVMLKICRVLISIQLLCHLASSHNERDVSTHLSTCRNAHLLRSLLLHKTLLILRDPSKILPYYIKQDLNGKEVKKSEARVNTKWRCVRVTVLIAGVEG